MSEESKLRPGMKCMWCKPDGGSVDVEIVTGPDMGTDVASQAPHVFPGLVLQCRVKEILTGTRHFVRAADLKPIDD